MIANFIYPLEMLECLKNLKPPEDWQTSHTFVAEDRNWHSFQSIENRQWEIGNRFFKRIGTQTQIISTEILFSL